MRVVYGIDIQSYNDEFVRIAEAASETVAAATLPGRFLVDMIPARKLNAPFRHNEFLTFYRLSEIRP